MDASDALEQAALKGMVVALVAARSPDKLAVASRFGDRTFGQLNARVNQLARLLREHGIGAGASIAVVSKNRPAFIEAYLAALRTGLRFTPVNFHLTAEEIGYVVDDCEADVVIFDGSLSTALDAITYAPRVRLRLIVDGAADGFVDYDAAIARFPGHDIDDPVRGTQMLYTSGTTGRPKGVYRRQQPRGYQNRVAGGGVVEPGDGRLPVYRTGLSRGAAGVQHRGAPQCRRWRRSDGQVGRRRNLASRRASSRNAHAYGRDDVPPAVVAAGGCAHALRPVQPALRHPWRRADAGPRKARDDRVVGPDRVRVLRRDRRRRQLLRHGAGVAAESRAPSAVRRRRS